MKVELRAFHVGDGDCLLMTASGDADGPREPMNILIDGGRSGKFSKHVTPYLYDNANLKTIDLVVVSHIDNDHISGILRLLKDKVKRRVWMVKKQAERTAGLPKKEPACPPHISKLWHNSVTCHFGDEPKSQAAGDSLATSAALLGGSMTALLGNPLAAAQAARLDNLATGHRSAIELETRIGGRLNIATEPDLLHAPASADEHVPCHDFSPFRLSVIGPSKERIDELAEQWDEWIKKNEAARQKLLDRLRSDEEKMGEIATSTVSPDGIALGSSESQITVPNLASLMLLVECGDRRFLLTGDGSSQDIIDGLGLVGCGNTHFDVLKVPHHGAEANVTDDFCEVVTADHYVFCGDGAHTNPELSVLRRIATARLRCTTGAGTAEEQQPAGPSEPFTFWFTSSSATPGLSDSRIQHMGEVEAEVCTLEQWIRATELNPLLTREEFDADPDACASIDEPRLRFRFLDADGGPSPAGESFHHLVFDCGTSDG